jgi:hypothetical protein
MTVEQLQEHVERLAGSRLVAAILVLTALMVLYCLPLPS